MVVDTSFIVASSYRLSVVSTSTLSCGAVEKVSSIIVNYTQHISGTVIKFRCSGCRKTYVHVVIPLRAPGPVSRAKIQT